MARGWWGGGERDTLVQDSRLDLSQTALAVSRSARLASLGLLSRGQSHNGDVCALDIRRRRGEGVASKEAVHKNKVTMLA